MIDNSLEVPNFNRLFFSNSTGSSVTNRLLSPTPAQTHMVSFH